MVLPPQVGSLWGAVVLLTPPASPQMCSVIKEVAHRSHSLQERYQQEVQLRKKYHDQLLELKGVPCGGRGGFPSSGSSAVRMALVPHRLQLFQDSVPDPGARSLPWVQRGQASGLFPLPVAASCPPAPSPVWPSSLCA